MITFGFTIYKFFELEVGRRPQIESSVLGPRGFALIMIGIGVLALLISTIQNHSSMQALRAEYGGAGPRSWRRSSPVSSRCWERSRWWQ